MGLQQVRNLSSGWQSKSNAQLLTLRELHAFKNAEESVVKELVVWGRESQGITMRCEKCTN